MKYLTHILFSFILFLVCSCSSGFDCEKANQLLKKQQLSEEDYTEMIEIYEKGREDAIRFAQESSRQLSKKQKEEMMLIYAIGMRLSKDDVNLSEKQRLEFERINLKGMEQAPQTK